MQESDLSYYRRRALQEDECVRKATSERARERHLELASAYRLRCAINCNYGDQSSDQDLSGASADSR